MKNVRDIIPAKLSTLLQYDTNSGTWLATGDDGYASAICSRDLDALDTLFIAYLSTFTSVFAFFLALISVLRLIHKRYAYSIIPMVTKNNPVSKYDATADKALSDGLLSWD